MQHVDEGRIHAWLDGELPEAGPDGARALELHLAACAACRARAEEERRFRDGAAAILRGADPGEPRLPGATPLPGADAAPVRRRDTGRRWVAVGWAASLLLALGVGWLARPAQREPVAIETRPAAEPPRVSPPPAAPAPTSIEPALPDTRGRRVDPAAADAPRATDAPMVRDRAPDADAAVVLPRRSGGAPAEAEPWNQPPAVTAPPAPPPPSPAAALESAERAAQESRAAEERRAQQARAARALVSTKAASMARAMEDATTLRGRVTDLEGRGLAGAQVSIPSLALRAVTGADGSYTLVVPEERLAGSDSVRVRVERIGYDARTQALLPRPEGVDRLDFALPSSSISLDALVVTGTDSSTGDVAWREVEWKEAERRLGRRLVAVPELPLLGIDLGEVEGRAAVRVRQRREDGSVLSLVQQRAPRPRSREREELERAVEERGGWWVVLEGEGLVVEASEPVSADSLRRLPPSAGRP